ncbi:hypothetical protein HOD75_04415 [archaeon]|jgi:hypothetical protein|nr:hypothetical protein [archaeon]MBT4242108.1 hypothetical protein [archaeon]MBT4417796.1 hypothetical protein [archaeon]
MKYKQVKGEDLRDSILHIQGNVQRLPLSELIVNLANYRAYLERMELNPIERIKENPEYQAVRGPLLRTLDALAQEIDRRERIYLRVERWDEE